MTGLVASLGVVLIVVHLPYRSSFDRVGWRVGERYGAISLSDLREAPAAPSPPATGSAPAPTTHRTGDVTGSAADRPAPDPPSVVSETALPHSRSTDRSIAPLATLDPSERPTLVGGIGALSLHIVYPPAAIRDGIQGRVLVGFTVAEDGTTTHVTVEETVHPLLDSAAVRAIRNVTFAPGRQNGTPVATRMTLPVRFRLVGARLDTTASTADAGSTPRPQR
jgi:TonB family protein